MDTKKRAKVCIFEGKSPADRVQGLLTAQGMGDFESARTDLARMASLRPGQVSDGDTIDFLARSYARGPKDPFYYIRARQQRGEIK